MRLHTNFLIGALACSWLLTGSYAAAKESKAKELPQSNITVDGSSTVFPVLEAIAEEFGKSQPNVRVAVGVSGTGGGFKRFCRGETDISNASRPIKETEIKTCKEHNVEFIELPIAYDALTVVTNTSTSWASCLTTAELKSIWEPNSKIQTWKQVRSTFPDKPLKLFGPGHDSGTFDYFTEVINGKSAESRKDFTASEDDNVLVQGIGRTVGSLGYFGYSYYVNNKSKLKAVQIDSGKGCVSPSEESVLKGTYTPLSRPLFIYVNAKAANKPEITELLRWTYSHSAELISSVGYIPLTSDLYKVAQARVDAKTTGTMFANHNFANESNLHNIYKVATSGTKDKKKTK